MGMLFAVEQAAKARNRKPTPALPKRRETDLPILLDFIIFGKDCLRILVKLFLFSLLLFLLYKGISNVLFFLSNNLFLLLFLFIGVFQVSH